MQFANWNVELAVSNWFERGESADANPDAFANIPAPAPPPLVQQVEVPEEDEYVGVLPGGMS